MTRNHDGVRFFQMIPPSGGPTLAWQPGGSGQFRCTGVPLVTAGNLCNHALGILLSFFIPIGAAGINPIASTGGRLGTSAYCIDDFIAALINSVKIEGALHKEPANEQTWKAAVLRTIEFVGCGFRYFGRQGPQVLHQGSRAVAPGGAAVFGFDIFLPLTYGLGEKGWQHNALPTFCYDNARLVLNFASGFNDGDPCNEAPPTLSSAVIRASLVMLPSQEINLAPAHEWIDYQVPASTSLSQVVSLDKFGLSTALDNVERGAGVDLLLWVSQNLRSTGYQGAASVKDLRGIGIPFRSQESTTHLAPFLRDMECAIDRPVLPATQDLIEPADLPVDTVGGDKAGWPYKENYQEPVLNSIADDNAYLDDPDVFPIIFPGRDLELTKIASYEADQQIQLTFASGTSIPAGRIHHCLAHQFKSWTPAGWEALLRKCVDSGVAKQVLGTSAVTHSLKLLKKNPEPAALDLSRVRYLPHKVVPLAAPTA